MAKHMARHMEEHMDEDINNIYEDYLEEKKKEQALAQITVTYAFTLRKTTKNAEATKIQYMNHLIKLKTFGRIEDVKFETTSGLHCHGILKVFKDQNLKRLRVRGWNLKLVKIYDMNGWQEYINKDQDDLMADMQDTPIDPDGGIIIPAKKLF